MPDFWFIISSTLTSGSGTYVGVGFKEKRIRVQDKGGKFINDHKIVKN